MSAFSRKNPLSSRPGSDEQSSPSYTSKTSNTTMEDTMDQMIYGKTKMNETAEFIPCSHFQGAKSGYYFGTRATIGTGYHLDHYGNSISTNSATATATATATSAATKPPPASILRPPRKKQKTGEELLAEIESQQQTDQNSQKILQLTPKGLLNATQSLQSTIAKNQMHRALHSNAPQQFMESELQLNDELMAWKDVAAFLNLYPFLVEYETIQLLLDLMSSHENNDVGNVIISIFVEWMDVDLVVKYQQEQQELQEDGAGADSNAKAQEFMNGIVQEFLKHGGLESVVDNLGRLNEDQEEEANGIDDSLTLIEALLDLDRLGILTLVPEQQPPLQEQKDVTKRTIVHRLLKNTCFLGWLFHRLEKGSFHPIKLHSAELLATILQHDDAPSFTNHLTSIPVYVSSYLEEDQRSSSKKSSTQKEKSKKITTIDGMEILLQAVAHYRKKDPTTEDECEYLENCCNVLSSSMLHSAPNIQSFLDAEGPELMLRCIREKVHSGGCCLRVLYFVLSQSSSELSMESSNVMTGGSSKSNGETDETEDTGDTNTIRKKACEYFVQAGGLSILFPIFMGRKSNFPKPAPSTDAGKRDLIQKAILTNNSSSKRAKRALQAKKEWIRTIESNTIQILYCLTRYIRSNSPYDAKDRLLVKFVEQDCEKCDRLVELCLKYDERMRLAEARYYRSDAAERAEEEGLDLELAALNAKLKSGGDLFHCLGAICAFVSVESKRCHEHILEQLKVKNSGISLIKASLEEFSTILDEGEQKSQIIQYYSLI